MILYLMCFITIYNIYISLLNNSSCASLALMHLHTFQVHTDSALGALSRVINLVSAIWCCLILALSTYLLGLFTLFANRHMLFKESNHFIYSFQKHTSFHTSQLFPTDYAIFQYQVFIPSEPSFLQNLLLLITSEYIIKFVKLSSGEHEFVEVLMQLQLGV